MKIRRALYPGSFDPITNGHIDIIRRALKMMDEVVVAVFDNPKKQPLFSAEERVDLIRASFNEEEPITVVHFDGLLARYAAEHEIFTVIRGLRAMSDFEYEFQMAITNRGQNEKIDTLLLMTDIKYSYLSSSLVKQLAQFEGEVSHFVPEHVKVALQEKTRKKGL